MPASWTLVTPPPRAMVSPRVVTLDFGPRELTILQPVIRTGRKVQL